MIVKSLNHFLAGCEAGKMDGILVRLGDGLGYGFLDVCKEECFARVDIVLDRLLNLVLDLVLLEVFLEEREVHPVPTI